MKKINYNNLCCYDPVDTHIEFFDPEVLLCSLAIIYTNGQFEYMDENTRRSVLFFLENEVNGTHYIFDNAIGHLPPDRIQPTDLYEAIVRAVIKYDGSAAAVHREDLSQIIEAFMTAFYIARGDGIIDLPDQPMINPSHLPFGEDRLTDFADHDILQRIEQQIPGAERVFGVMMNRRRLHVYTQSDEAVFEYVVPYQALRSSETLTVETTPDCSCVMEESVWNDGLDEIEDLLDY